MGQIHIQEESRPLREFYPDPEERARMHYLFAHRFFPPYFFMNPFGVVRGEDEEESTRYIQARWQMMEQQMGLVESPRFESGHAVFRRVADLRAWSAEVADHPALCVEMPAPERSPQALYFAAVLLVSASVHVDERPRDASGRFFTLERGVNDDNTGVLCEWTSDAAHQNYGVSLPPGAPGFAAAITSVIRDTS